MKNEPLVSIIIPTRNNREQLRYLLSLIHKQNYKNIEIIISDGMSTDGTREMAVGKNVTLVDNKRLLAEPGVSTGFNNAHGEFIMILAVDNYFYSKDDLKKIIGVFKDPKIFAAFPKHESKPNYSIYSKYINTFTDPFNHFVYGDASNARTFHRIYRTIEQNKSYDIYDFNSSDIKPILAFAQGFIIRKQYQRGEDNELDDISPVLQVISQGKKIAYVHSVSLYHDTIRDAKHFLRKMEWAANNALLHKKYGIANREDSLTIGQKIRKLIFPFYSFSIILPIFVALYKTVSERKSIWLLHPWITLLTAYAILKQVILKVFNFTENISRL